MNNTGNKKMQKEFFKNKAALIFVIGTFIIVEIVILSLVVSALLGNENIAVLYPAIIACVLPLIFLLFIFFCRKEFLSKVVFSEEGLEWKLFKKQLLFIKWEEITDVKVIVEGVGNIQPAIYRNSEKIQMEASRKAYDSFMKFCPDPNIKAQISKLKCFKFMGR